MEAGLATVREPRQHESCLYRNTDRLRDLTERMFEEGSKHLCLLLKSDSYIMHTSLVCCYSKVGRVRVSEMSADHLKSMIARGQIKRMPRLEDRFNILARQCNVCMHQFVQKKPTFRDHFEAAGISAEELNALPRPASFTPEQIDARKRKRDDRDEERLRVDREVAQAEQLAEQLAAQAAQAAQALAATPERRPDNDYNVHQSSINALVVRATEALESYPVKQFSDITSWEKVHPAWKETLLFLQTRSGPHVVNILGKVLGKICTDYADDLAKKNEVVNILMYNVRDCFMRVGTNAAGVRTYRLVCPHGCVTRILSTFDGVQDDWRVGVSNAMLSESLGTLGARLREEGKGKADFVASATQDYGSSAFVRQLIDDFAHGFDE